MNFFSQFAVPQKSVGLHKTFLRFIPQRSEKIKSYVNFILNKSLGMFVVVREKLETIIL